GTAAAEVINALGGADWITPGGGNDTIDGGDGNDMVSFIDLPDTPGRTNLQFRLDVDLGAGTARSHDGSEQMQLSNVERVTGTIYADYIRGDAGANHLRGAGDYDWFVATTGNDTLDGGTGQDMVTFVEWQNTGPNAISDAFSADGAPPTGAQATGVLVDLANPANNTNLASGLTLISIERVTGSGRQDVFYGDGNSNDFRGLGDYDWFVGSAGGRERYFGGDGIDTVTYFMSGEGVTASLRNGARVNGEETGYGSRGDAARDLYFEIENLVGTRFDDRLTGNSGRNQLSGLEGDDFLFGYEDVDYLKGGAGNDTIDGGTGSDYALFDGDRAEYTLTRTADNAVTVTGPDGTDSLINVEYFRFDDGDVRIWDLAL
ncbi:type I secretion target repeat-containing protein, partial [Ruegeria pomeroyi]|nr:type I secretion target repeat-containing protein [Ruegeria pomeroyi]